MPFLKFDGLTLIARDNADLWDESIPNFVNVDFSGAVFGGEEINTGTSSNGTGASSGVFGGPYGERNGTEIIANGYTGRNDTAWVGGFARDTRVRLYYAIFDVLTVQDISGVTYNDWVAGPWAGTLTDPDTNLDFDGGGLETGIEWVVGGDPTLGSDDASVAPISENSDPSFFTFIYRISDEASADADTTVTVEYGSDLSGWTSAIDNDSTIEITTDDGTGEDEGFDIVTVKIDRSLADDEKLFTRLKVSVGAP